MKFNSGNKKPVSTASVMREAPIKQPSNGLIIASSMPAPKAPPNQIGINNKPIVILKLQNMVLLEDTKELDKMYSEKFGCKVVVVQSNIEFVEYIDG